MYVHAERRGLISAAGVADRVFSDNRWVPLGRLPERSEPVDLGDKAHVFDGDGCRREMRPYRLCRTSRTLP